jgi:hypothetical protein
MKDGFDLRINQSQNSSATANFAASMPRLWMIMIAFAVPFLIISSHFFEALEITGGTWAFISDMLLPATNIAYVVLIFILKNKKI